MRYSAVSSLILVAAGCRTPSDDIPQSANGYLGIEKIAIVARGME